ncbi:hypothetical protein [Sporosarcina sp. FSL K6-3457]|uniref:hypothetical protein n=1 Tax=Sporosarcina sp. FSL K6-3457 TaxID=2978204 RepID=UPI0030F966A5
MGWASSIQNAAKQTVQDQIWPVTIATSAIGGAGAAANAINKNKVSNHVSNISNVKLPVANVGKAVASTAVKGTGIGFAVSVGVNFGYRLGQERAWW